MGRTVNPHRANYRRRLLAASSIAMATAMLHPAPAFAQSTTDGVAVRAQAQYDGTKMTYTPGTTVDVVRVNTSDTLINWVPFDTATGGGAISFLPAGNGLFYIFDGTAYTVVNRIMPTDATRAVRFDGQVASFVNNGGALGGNIFFYSPGGIIVGSTGRFDVGSLVLTTSDILSTGTTLSFGASSPDARITIEPWAATAGGDMTPQIQTFGGDSSYFAVLAPTVEQYGRVDAQGNVAYVAAEQATMTISGSLFDIVVNTGTTSTKGVEHTGVTTGAAVGANSSRRIQMVAVPKNTALTMLVSGSVGYTPAASAAIVNGTIVLTAGDAKNAIDGNIKVGASEFSVDTTMNATGNIDFGADGDGTLVAIGSAAPAVGADLTANAGGNITAQFTNGAGMRVRGSTTLTAGSGGTGGDVTLAADATGVDTTTSANGFDLSGPLQIFTSATGSDDFGVAGVGGDATGGDVSINLTNGAQLNTNGASVYVDTSAQAGFGTAQAGNATAGKVSISLDGTGGVLNTDDIDVFTLASAAVPPPSGGGTALIGGDARGGDFSLSLSGGAQATTGVISVSSSAQATDGSDSSVAQDNSARAGDVTFSFAGGTHDIFYIDVTANGTSADSFDGAGNLVAGSVGRAKIGIDLNGATVAFSDDAEATADTAGDISAETQSNAFEINAINGSSLTITYLNTSTRHDNRESPNLGTGGGVSIFADNSIIDLGSISFDTSATVTFASSPKAADLAAGDIGILATNGSEIYANGPQFDARATYDFLGAAAGPASYNGGAVSIVATDSRIGFSGTRIDTSVDVARGGDMSGITSSGGSVLIQQSGSTADVSLGDLDITTSAIGATAGDNFAGDGGNAAGGDVIFDVQGGDFSAGIVTVDTSAVGNIGGAQIVTAGDIAGQGGSATAGDITFTMAGTDFVVDSLDLTATAQGGTGGRGESSLGAGGSGAGGAATGGSIGIHALAGNVSVVNTITTDASAQGGTGGFGTGTSGGAGGAATGGGNAFEVGGATFDLDSGTLALGAQATGGTGGGTAFDFGTGQPPGTAGDGGAATGGTVSYVHSGGTIDLVSLSLDASATGGVGGDKSGSITGTGGSGGDATGGSATVTQGVDEADGPPVRLTAAATGGYGGTGPNGGAGGNATGGTAQFNVDNASVGNYSLQLDARGTGGGGGYAYNTGGTGGTGGNGTGGSSGIDVFGLDASLTTNAGMDITSAGFGGTGGDGSYLGDGGAGGAGRGGSIQLVSRDGGSLDLLASNIVNASGNGGYGGAAGGYDSNPPGFSGAGGAGYGGSISLSVTGGADLTASSTEGAVIFTAAGIGGRSGAVGYYGYYGSYGNPGPNGAATGGSISLVSAGAGSKFQVIGDIFASATATGVADFRSRSSGADATGGSITAGISGGGSIGVTGNATFDSSALAALGTLLLGDATGGSVDLTMSGASSVLNVGGILAADASAIDSRTESSTYASATGGNFTGGSIDIDLAAGTATVTGGTQLIAIAGVDTSEGPGYGETVLGGTVNFINDGSANFTTGTLDIDTYALGTGGSPASGTTAEAGGDATGGSVYFSNQGTGSVTASAISIDSHAVGGSGGRGSDIGGMGGVGGSGTGGTIDFVNGAGLTVQDLTVVAAGDGGGGGGGTVSNIGGNGIGGAITLSIGSTVSGMNQLWLTATGTGGFGVTSFDPYSSYGGTGSTGGNGAGGSIMLELTGTGTVLATTTDFSLGLDVTGTGGRGGYGGYGYFGGGNAGDGGDGTGGSLTLASRSGATLDLSGLASVISADGVGGAGSTGGYGGFGDGVSGAGYGGNGGNGGTGQGGALTLIGQGGTLTAGDIQLTSTGTGGLAGVGGSGYYSPGAVGLNGGGIGGLVSIQALEGSPGIITLGATVIDASGLGGGGDLTVPTTGGSIEITDSSVDPAGLITLGSLTATALGMLAPADASFTLSGDSGPITVLGDTLVNVVGDIVFSFDGTGQLVVGGTTTLNAGGDILLTHTNNPTGIFSIDSAGDFTATAGGNFDAGAGSIANGGGNVSITALDIVYDSIDAIGSITLNALAGSIGFTGLGDLTAGTFIDLDATQSITIGDAESATGFDANAGTDVGFGTIFNSGGDLTVNAGGSISGVSAINDAPLGTVGTDNTTLIAKGDITVIDTIQSLDDDVSLNAGGNIDVGALVADNAISAIAGGTLSATSAFTANAGSTALLRGTSVSLGFGTLAGSLTLDATAGDVNAGGTISAGEAIDIAATGAIALGNLTAGTTFNADAGTTLTANQANTLGGDLVFTAGGLLSIGSTNVVGLLSLTGDLVIVGTGTATNIAINSNTDILFDSLSSPNSIALSAAGGSIAGYTVPGAIDSGGDVTLDAQDIALGDIGALGAVSAASSVGDATFGMIQAGTSINLDSAGNLAFDTATAGSSFDAFATGGIAFNSVDAVTGANLGSSGVGGIAGGDVTVSGLGGSISLFAFGAGEGVLAGALATNRGDIFVQADGDLSLASATTGLNDPAAAPVAGTIALLAGGAITAATGAGTSLVAGEDIAMMAGGAATLGTLLAGDDIDIAAASVSLGNAATLGTGSDAFAVSFTDGIFFTAETLPGSTIEVDATGAIDATGNITGAGGVFLTGGSVSLGSGTHTAQGELTVEATAGDITGGAGLVLQSNSDGSGGEALTLQSDSGVVNLAGSTLIGGTATNRSAVLVQSDPSLVLGDVTAASLSSIGSTSLAVTGPLTLGNLLLDNAFSGIARAGSLTVGDVTIGSVGSGIGLYAGGATSNIAAGSLATNGGDILASAGRDIALASAATGAGTPTGGTIAMLAGGNLAATGSLIAGEDVAIRTSGDAALATVAAGDDVTISSGGAISLASATSTGTGTDLFSIVFNPANAGQPGSIAFAAETAPLTGANIFLDAGTDVTATGALDASNAITVVAGGTPTLANVISGGDTSVTGSSIAFNNGTVGGMLRLDATAGNIDAGGTISVGGAIDFDATGDVGFGSLDAGAAFTVDAGGAITFVRASSPTSIAFAAGGGIFGGDLDVAGPLTLDGATIAIGNAVADSIAFTSGNDILFDSLIVRGPLDLTAAGGTIGANAGPGDIAADGDVTLLAQDIALGDVTTGGSLGATATAGGATFGAVQAANAISVDSAGATSIANAISGGDTSLTGSAVTLPAAAVGGSLSLTATAGDILGPTGPVTVGGAVALDASGGISFGTLAAQGGDFSANAGGSIAFIGASSAGDATFAAGGAIAGGDIAAGGTIDLTAGTTLGFGSLDATGDASLVATGAIAGNSVIAGGNILLDGASIDLAGATAGGNLTGSASTGNLSIGSGAAGGNIFVQSAGSTLMNSLDAGSAISILAGADIAAGSLTAGGSITAVAGGTLMATSAIAGDALDLRAGSTLTIADAIGGTVGLRSIDGAVIVTHDLDSTFTGTARQAIVSGAAVQIDDVNGLFLTLGQATNGDFDATAAGDIAATSIESVGDIILTSTGGGVSVGLAEAGKTSVVPAGIAGVLAPAGSQVGNPGPGNIAISAAGTAQGAFIASGDIGIDAGAAIDLDSADAAGSIGLNAGGPVRIFGPAAAGADINVSSSGDVLVANSGASLEAGGDLSVTALGLFETQGFAYGTNVSITARDVNIGSSGQIGDAGLTQSVTFTSIGGPVVIGGSPVSGAFSLDSDEFGRIRNGGDLSILARSANGEAVTLQVNDLTIAAGNGGPMGANSTLRLDSAGTVDLLGALTVANAGDQAGITIRSLGRTWLDTAGGNLRIESPEGLATGTIDIFAPSFMAVSASALADIAGMSAVQIDSRLARNDGVVRDEGFIQAGALHVTVTDALLIQNSGTGTRFADRRGFSVDSFVIDTSTGARPLIVVNGTVAGLTGLDALAEIAIAGGFAPGSTVNGCALDNVQLCTIMQNLQFFDPSHDVIKEEIKPGFDAESLELDVDSQLIDLSPPAEFDDDPLIDDPVTGAGNEDLWQGGPACDSGGAAGQTMCATTAGEETEPAE